MVHSSLGMRMKEYEKNPATDNGVNMLRVDGRAFHTWTKKVLRHKGPFSHVVHDCMTYATEYLAADMQGFKLAYTQSDESTFLMENLGEKTEAWFGGKTHKITSIAASVFTYAFNSHYKYYVDVLGYPDIPAYFDARVHSIPVEDAPNNFVWRQKDWQRNSIQMLGQWHLGQSVMNGLSNQQVLNELNFRGISWDDLDEWKRYGTFIGKNQLDPKEYRRFVRFHDYLDYRDVAIHAGISQYIDWTK